MLCEDNGIIQYSENNFNITVMNAINPVIFKETVRKIEERIPIFQVEVHGYHNWRRRNDKEQSNFPRKYYVRVIGNIQNMILEC